jgi:hypothetical protein
VSFDAGGGHLAAESLSLHGVELTTRRYGLAVALGWETIAPAGGLFRVLAGVAYRPGVVLGGRYAFTLNLAAGTKAW